MIPVYGLLSSTWPVASGVLIEDGTVYAAAGIANFDGTYVYALDAVTGQIKWQNNTSGHLDRQARTGVSVQGHLLLHNDKLYMPGGTSVSPAVYNAADGTCLNDPGPLATCRSGSPRGWELSLLGDQVVACGKAEAASWRHNIYGPADFSSDVVRRPERQKLLMVYAAVKCKLFSKSGLEFLNVHILCANLNGIQGVKAELA